MTTKTDKQPHVAVPIRSLATFLLLGSLFACRQGGSPRHAVHRVVSPGDVFVYIDGYPPARAPVVGGLAGANDHVLRIEADSFAPLNLEIHKQGAAWYYSRVSLGGTVGLAVDVFDGSVYLLTAEHVNEMTTGDLLALRKASLNDRRFPPPQPLGPDVFYVAAVKTGKSDWQKFAQLRPLLPHQ